MKKLLFFIVTLVVLNGCVQSTAFLGPAYTLAKTGSIGQVFLTQSATYGFKKATGKSINEHALSAFTEEMRQCEKTHSSELSEVFFITLDEIDCTTIN